METYADYNYYSNKYKGKLDNSSFDKFATQASIKIYNLTSGRAIPEIIEVKQCMCELVDAMYANSKKQSDISSEKVDNYTINYVVKSNSDKNKEYYSIVEEHLGRIGLMGRGGVCVY